MTEAARIAAGGSDTRLRSPPAAWRSPERIAYWAILACGIAARCVYFGQIPDGVHVDEATGAVDGYAIFHFGTDRWNNVFPAEFDSANASKRAMEASHAGRRGCFGVRRGSSSRGARAAASLRRRCD